MDPVIMFTSVGANPQAHLASCDQNELIGVSIEVCAQVWERSAIPAIDSMECLDLEDTEGSRTPKASPPRVLNDVAQRIVDGLRGQCPTHDFAREEIYGGKGGNRTLDPGIMSAVL
jgi:hypothetical protein